MGELRCYWDYNYNLVVKMGSTVEVRRLDNRWYTIVTTKDNNIGSKIVYNTSDEMILETKAAGEIWHIRIPVSSDQMRLVF